MKQTKLKEWSTQQLVDRFAANCLEQDQAILYYDTAAFNKLYLQAAAIRDELKHRPGDQRRALQALYDHPNVQVRLQAARMSFATAPDAARAVIEQIAATAKGSHAGDAGMTLWNLDRGVFKPR